MIFRMCLLTFISRIRGGTGAFMLGDEYSYCFLQQGLRLQLNKQLVNYLTVYNKSYPDLNPSCTAVDTISTLGERHGGIHQKQVLQEQDNYVSDQVSFLYSDSFRVN